MTRIEQLAVLAAALAAEHRLVRERIQRGKCSARVLVALTTFMARHEADVERLRWQLEVDA